MTKPVISGKPYPISIEMRPLWRISLVVMAIKIVGGTKNYLPINKANILVWMLIRASKWDEYREFLFFHSEMPPLVSVDTATYKAIEIAVSKKFLELKESRLFLLPAGENLLSLLAKNKLMSDEMSFLTEIGKKLTAKKIKELTGA